MATDIYWPGTLPQQMEKDSYSYEPMSAVVRTEMETGYAKQRTRFTAVPVAMGDTNWIMTAAQVSTFKLFFVDTLGRGALSFYLPDPLQPDEDDEWIEVRITDGTYSIVPEDETLYWEVSINLEEMP